MIKKSFKYIIASILSILLGMLTNGTVFADGNYGIMMSPPNQKIILTPGESYVGTFSITNVSDRENFNYTTEITPFYVDENYKDLFDDSSAFTQITEWTTIKSQKGTLLPSAKEDIVFRIDVPMDAPAGGQYMTISVVSDETGSSDEKNTTLIVQQAMAHIIYAEIAGTTVRQGEVTEASVPSFLLSGNIAGTSSIKNTGNVHGTATYKLQVFPLFSNEEVYTNEEDPETKTILPDRTLMSTNEWANTPAVGIFNVVYTVEFEGVTTQVSKMVIKCPIWLLAIIIFIIAAIIIWLLSKSKARKKASR